MKKLIVIGLLFLSNNVNAEKLFDSFDISSNNVTLKLKCSQQKIVPAIDFGDGVILGRMYQCIQGNAQTAKYFINENYDNQIKDVKVMWNDWFDDKGEGIHSDKQEAENMIKYIATLYAPNKAKALINLFFGNTNGELTTDSFKFVFSYRRGPSIDERLLVITSLQ